MLHGNESWFTEAGTNCNAVPPISERGRDPFARLAARISLMSPNSHNGMNSRDGRVLGDAVEQAGFRVPDDILE